MSGRFLALLLVLALVPATGELVETVIHLVQHGDVPHAGEHADETSGIPTEHGCTGVFHACSCHSTVAASSPTGAPVLAVQDEIDTLAAVRPRSWPGEGPAAPWIRPPIS